MNIFRSSGASTATRIEPRAARHEQEISCNKSSSSSGGSITPRLMRVLSTPCSSSFELALSPSQVDYKQLQKQQSGRKSSSSCYVPADKGVVSDKHLIRRRSSADVKSLRPSAALVPASGRSYDDQITKLERSSSRLLDPPLTTLVHRSSGDELDSPNLKSSSSLPHRLSADKVVVLWVSLHCKGCEAKLKKHISRMEGVKSFSTDLATKRVTIISDMNPNDVLARVSRVKYAQFWPSSSSHDFHLSSSSTS
ncbi:unnamed protein product [Rhodiola kirilowii]